CAVRSKRRAAIPGSGRRSLFFCCAGFYPCFTQRTQRRQRGRREIRSLSASSPFPLRPLRCAVQRRRVLAG
ncbi:MAG: hypothetical protein AVDCRST_MAG89-3102, partial [uncultured Gemmatimonadetes bacterium]